MARVQATHFKTIRHHGRPCPTDRLSDRPPIHRSRLPTQSPTAPPALPSTRVVGSAHRARASRLRVGRVPRTRVRRPRAASRRLCLDVRRPRAREIETARRATRTSSSHSLESLRTVERSDGEGMKRSRDDGPGSSAVVKRCARETRSVKLVRAGGCVSCLVSSLVVANGRSDRRARDARRNGRRGNCTRDRRVESAPSLRPTDRPMPGWGRDDGAGRGSMDGS